MTVLLSGYDRLTGALMFRIYAAEIPAAERKTRNRTSHFYAMDVLGAALAEDFGVRHAKIVRKGLEKPLLVHEELHMNLSHCKGLAVAAVAKMPVGVDAEPPRDVAETLMRKILSPKEIIDVKDTAPAEREFRFSRYWTLKEAYTKYTGEGIRRQFSSLCFRLSEPPDTVRREAIEFQHPAAGKVHMYQLLRGNEFAVSLCVPRLAEFDLSKPAEGWELLTDKE